MKEKEYKATVLISILGPKVIKNAFYCQQERERKARKMFEDDNTPIKIRDTSQIKKIFEDRK